jgi:cysteinyl-tRNA synthetase, unknown class
MTDAHLPKDPAMKHTLLALAALTITPAQADTAMTGPGPFAVYNQAYQENFAPDQVADILVQARDAYVLLDPFGEDAETDWAQIVAALQANGNAVGAYISIGTGEDWRADFAALQPHLVTTSWDEWAGEYFVSSTAGVLPIMKARIDRIVALGFDWVEFDNMDWVFDDDLRASHGFAATIDDGVAYFQALCAHAQTQGLRCMAKNMTAGAETFDGVLYESYSDDRGWWDQDGALGFVAAGKPVIIVHYGEADCAGVLANYRAIYGENLSFLCEDSGLQRYVRLDGQGQ